jgi:fatty acid/phospholipid biosynthesis enzyme
VTERIDLQPSADSMLTWDGTVLEIFAGSVSGRFHIKGIADIEVSEGFGRNIMIKNRFGSDVGISYDKERLAEVREFLDQVLAAARSAG